jgi:hypothetical protein
MGAVPGAGEAAGDAGRWVKEVVRMYLVLARPHGDNRFTITGGFREFEEATAEVKHLDPFSASVAVIFVETMRLPSEAKSKTEEKQS